MSSMRMMSTFGAPAGAFNSKRGGGFAFRASSSVKVGAGGSWMGSTVRSIAPGAVSPRTVLADAASAPISARARKGRGQVVLFFIFFMRADSRLIAGKGVSGPRGAAVMPELGGEVNATQRGGAIRRGERHVIARQDVAPAIVRPL